MTDIEQRREWLQLLEEALARRTARVEWQAGEDERQREQLIDTLQQMAQRLGASAQRVPLDTADMSIAEMFAVRWFLPEDMWPAGLPSEAEIWREYEARKQGVGYPIVEEDPHRFCAARVAAV